jgi:hypothetical protein
MGTLAASFTFNGLHGALLVIAVLLFLVAAIAAWFASPRTHWATLVAAGLCLATLALLVTG